VRVGRDYKTLYEGLKAVTPFATESVMNAADFTADFWWIVAIGAILLTMLFYAVTKSGTIFTVLSILVWLAGVAAYVALWLPSRGLERAAGG
jgi:type II secretory pathway component PulF